MKNGGNNEIPACEVTCQADVFENAIRAIGVVFACEWFGHSEGSDFTRNAIKTLSERSGVNHEQ